MPRRDSDQLALLGDEFLPTTPIRRQYLELKARHPDAILFFRLGDFYETFDEDARVVAETLEIVLTGREMGRGELIPMAGVPYHAAEGYIARLIARGHRVAICDQIGDPPRRGLVHREVVRVVSPGTIVEDALLPVRANNFLAALMPERSGAGLAYVDVTTGHLAATEIAGRAWETLASAELVRIGPSECLVPGELGDLSTALAELLRPGARPTPRGAGAYAPHRAAERLRDHFDARTVASLGLDERPLAARATAALLEYVEETLPSALSLLDRLDLYDVSGAMVLDAATRRSLELTESARSGGRAGSLLAALDETRTPMGARRLRQWVSRPLLDAARIGERHAAVAYLLGQPVARAGLADVLHRMPDLERLATRATQRILAPREALGVATGVRLMGETRSALEGTSDPLLESIHGRLHDFGALADRIVETMEDPPPANLGDGVIRQGCSAELDETRALSGNTKAWIANLERAERERTGVRGLKIGYNRVFGYYLELSKSAVGQPTDYYQRELTQAATVGEHLERLGYIRRQTLTNGERFVTAELQEYEIRVRNAQEELIRLERGIFRDLVESIAGAARDLLDAAGALATLDVIVGFADVAGRRDYRRPEFVEGDVLEIVDGRHPVVELVAEPGSFVANSTSLGGSHGRIAILTGPNMAGKSTYLRQVALIVLLAQIGSFVPAASARLGIVDRIFARVGAQDDLTAHRSTFMVEMIETANIVRNATPRSLLILDEIGRGTSTFDGIAVARAVVEHIHDEPRLGCKTLFATHYHELAELEQTLSHVRSLRVDVLERGDQVVFLHRVVPGAADRSYGVHVARLAGAPESVTRRAAAILRDLELARSDGTVRPSSAKTNLAGTIEDADQHPAIRRLASLDPLRMSPLDALAELVELHRLATEEA